MATHVCELCDGDEYTIFFCTACNFSLCNECWTTYPPHRKGLLGPNGLPHEKANPIVVQELKSCMDEPTDDNERQLHQVDEETTWFGLERDDGGAPILAEYRRYAAVMMQISQISSKVRYPSLVSFIGQTGAGKSSVIKLLIDLKTDVSSGRDKYLLSAPVVGRSASSVPTSADVHLYLSPDTMSDTQPILYADCEGFNGGEQDPVAVGAVAAPDTFVPSSNGQQKIVRPSIVQRVSQGTKRLLKWASRDSEQYEETSKRGFTVSEMYPRIFYAFSDVIVFVLDNPKTLEVIVERLLEWGDANFSKSINQPIKPHAVIVLNKSNTKTPEDQWDHINATAHLLNTTNAKIYENRTFAKYAKIWKERTTSRIDSMQDLLRCYYFTVQVVRIPEKSRYQLLNVQREQLHTVITQCCAMSFQEKRDRELLTDVDEFGLYLSLAFDHFSETLDEPFNFVEASLKRYPSSNSLADDLISFIRQYAVYRNVVGNINLLFAGLTKFIASCILLEALRKQRIGRPEDWFGGFIDADPVPRFRSAHQPVQPIKKPKPGSYREICRKAILTYLKSDVPCGFVFPKRSFRSQRRCEVRYEAHDNGHRAGSAHFVSGKFESKVLWEDVYLWEEKVLQYMIETHDRLKKPTAMEFRSSVIEAHKLVLQDIYRRYSTQIPYFQMNSICIACLCNPAQHELACHHIICSQCARDFGKVTSTSIIVDVCPLCVRTATSAEKKAKSTPSLSSIPDSIDEKTITASIPLLPAQSGLRVLVLDGGGIRGIVELCVLKAVEDYMGIKINQCFDLVVGTSTGGIIALGLGHHGWTVERCIREFQALVRPAFTKRTLQGVAQWKALRGLQFYVKHSKYETRPLEDVLWRTFDGYQPLFPAAIGPERLRTAVTACSSSGACAWVLSNYATLSGQSGRGPAYKTYRPVNPRYELCTYEAARSTSAAPGFFRPYTLLRDYQRVEEWIDGALLHNNPVEIALEEARRIAETEMLNMKPDIVVSIGTGLTDHKKRVVGANKNVVPEPDGNFLKMLFTIVKYQVELNTNADRRWDQVIESDKELAKRMYRINPDLGMDPPQLDEVDKVPLLAKEVPLRLAEDWAAQQKIRQVSASLMGTLFFFEAGSAPTNVTASVTEINGWIRCRLSGNYLSQIAKFLSLSTHPEFRIHKSHRSGEDVRVEIPLSELHSGKFKGIHTTFTISGDDVSSTIALRIPGICDKKVEFPISGFPRQMLKTDFGPGRPCLSDVITNG